jgi:thiol-disulfide isomerase/thioredoxin
MKKLLCILWIILTTQAFAQQVPLVKSSYITQLKNNQSDTVYVINFWATWCKPCIEELPYFEQLTQTYADKKVKVILVSTDFKKQINSRLKPFIVAKKIYSQVVFMDESNPNDWINSIDKNWSGAIPATLIICGKKKFTYFEEGETTFEKLNTIIKPLLDN